MAVRTIDRVINYVKDLSDFSIVEKEVIISRLDVAPSRAEMEAAKERLQARGEYP